MIEQLIRPILIFICSIKYDVLMYYTEYDRLIFNVWNSLGSLCFCKTGYDSEDSRLSNAVNAD